MTEQTKKFGAEEVTDPEQFAALLNKQFAKYNDLLSNTASKGELKQVFADLIVENKDLMNKVSNSGKEMTDLKKQLADFTETIKIQGDSITKMKTAFSPGTERKSLKDAVLKALTDGAFSQVADKKASNASFTVETKDITMGGFSGGAPYQAGAVIQPAMPFQNPVFTPQEDFDVRSVLPIGTSESSMLEFPQEKAWTDNMGLLAENADSTESEVTFEMASVQGVRLSTHITVSRTALKNVAWLSNHISTRLMGKFIAKLNSQVIAGTGLTVYLKGLTGYATTFTAGGLANAIANANWIDVLLAARARNYEVNKIKPNVVFVNPLDAVVLTSIKSTIGEWANKEPFMTVSPNGVVSIMGMNIIESFDVTAGTYIMANVSSQNMEILFNGPVEILATDSEASNFLKNLVTIKLEAVVLMPVYRAGAIIKGTFATDLTAITPVV